MKKICIFLVVAILSLSLVACNNDVREAIDGLFTSSDTNYPDNDTDTNVGENNGSNSDMQPRPLGSTDTDWAIYWYLCGSDLETDGGYASTDLEEMMQVELPEGVQIIIQTGGAYEWHNDYVDPNYIERYIYDSDGMQLIEQLPVANMGETDTLVDFLEFASTNYPADRTMLNFWNHGGGSVSGAAFDELFNSDSLTLDEMNNALISVYGQDNEYYPLDIVGFDTCLMATLSTGYAFSSHANYLVASQELEPGGGWYYSGIVEALADNPTIEPAELSTVICDTYVYGCEIEGTESDITLSVTDLSKLGNLIKEFDEYANEALSYALEDSSFFSQLSRAAQNSENYGGNNREDGYTNMVDIGHLMQNTSDLFPDSTQDVISALDAAVIYSITSAYRPDGMGLSTYYSYDGDVNGLNSFIAVNPVSALNQLYSYGFTGQVDESYLEENFGYEEQDVPELDTLESEEYDWDSVPIYMDNNGSAVLELGPDAENILSTLVFELYYTSTDEDDELILSLGSDNDIISDWQAGVFKDNFRGVWGYLDGAICYMDIVYEGDDYNEYAVPILLNGEEYNLSVIYDFNIGEYIIYGARKPLTSEGAADKSLRQLNPGDVIQTIHYISDIYSDNDFEPYVIDTITVTNNTRFTEEQLPDGYYFLMYRMEDYRGNVAYSDIATFESYEGELYVIEE